jgi:hypothetical protein
VILSQKIWVFVVMVRRANEESARAREEETKKRSSFDRYRSVTLCWISVLRLPFLDCTAARYNKVLLSKVLKPLVLSIRAQVQ